MAALFRALEMRLYFETDKPFPGPILDVGCGDGGVAAMLQEGGVIERPLCGLDYDHNEIQKAKKTRGHLLLLQADANFLPFPEASFSTVICNGVLCSIPGGVDCSLQEIHRILKPGGFFVATVPTDKFMEVLPFPRVFAKLSSCLSACYIERLNKRLPHYTAFSGEEWEKKLEEHGLQVITKRLFFSPQAGFLWNLLSLQVFRICGVLKLLKNVPSQKRVSALLQRLFEKTYQREREGEASHPYGYAFIITRKSP